MLFSCGDSGRTPLQTWLMCQIRQPTQQHYLLPGQPARPLCERKARQHSIDQTMCALEPHQQNVHSITLLAGCWQDTPASTAV